MKFEWDEPKAAANVKKHGINFEEASTVFRDLLSATGADLESALVSQTCSFETSRLIVKEWHSLTTEEWVEQDLTPVVAGMLTAPVTRSLPPGWQGSYTAERARQWIEERDQEGTTLLVVERSEQAAVGLVILFESEDEGSRGVELRLGLYWFNLASRRN